MTLQKDPEQNETRHLNKLVDFTGKRMLEVGAGEGRLTWRIATRTSYTSAIDMDQDALRVATIDRPSDLEDRIHFSNAMAEHLPFSRETFDIAVLAWSF